MNLSDIYTIRNGKRVRLTTVEVDALPQITLEDLKANLKAEVNQLRDTKLEAGFAHDFGEPHGVKVMDTRNVNDRVNWIGGMLIYQGHIAAGNGDVVGAKIRTADNINISLSYKAAAAAISAVGDYANAILNNSWTLKDAISAAPDEAALAAIDITTGWPG
ncbi:hypothetical protein [Roseibium sp.]|uniref:DUF4376 domain-containing protein n=1 Tax=Roseibium sp. TaxID=1936156 RepID=UPI003B51F175